VGQPSTWGGLHNRDVPLPRRDGVITALATPPQGISRTWHASRRGVGVLRIRIRWGIWTWGAPEPKGVEGTPTVPVQP
jgi:hypothetical protein